MYARVEWAATEPCIERTRTTKVQILTCTAALQGTIAIDRDDRPHELENWKIFRRHGRWENNVVHQTPITRSLIQIEAMIQSIILVSG